MATQFAQALKNEQSFAIVGKTYLDDDMSDLDNITQAELDEAEKNHDILIIDELVNFGGENDYLKYLDSVILTFSQDEVKALKNAIKFRLMAYLGINTAQELIDRSKALAELFKEHYSNFSNVTLTGLGVFNYNDTLCTTSYRLDSYGNLEMYPSFTHEETIFNFNFGVRDRDLPFKAQVSFMLSSELLADCIF